MSYVWGTRSNKKKYALEEPSEYPQTIKDAIEVTERLGYLYLWVDAYCIDDQDQKRKAQQITEMDLVYWNANATIIAAAGEDSSYGLSGISKPRQPIQAAATIRDVSFVTAETNPWFPVLNSKWHTRGWTCQEGFLSRRRIFFTEHQLIFDCGRDLECETRLDLDYWDKSAEIPRWNYLTDWNESSIYDLISSYTKRSFTYSTDILAAFARVLNCIKRAKFHMLNHWGVLILQGRKIHVWTLSLVCTGRLQNRVC